MSREQVSANKLLHLAVAKENLASVVFLLRHGADPNARVHTGEDPLQRYGGPRSYEMCCILESLETEYQGQRRRSNTVASSTLIKQNEGVTGNAGGQTETRGRSYSFLSGNKKPKSKRPSSSSGGNEVNKYGTWDINKYRQMAKEYMKKDAKIVEWSGEEVAEKQLEETKNEGSKVKPANQKRSFTFGFFGGWIGRGSQPTIDLNKPTAMHQAAATGNTRIIKELTRHGGDVNAELDGVYAPLDIAALYGHREAVVLLISLGAKVNAHFDNGHTALYHAAKARQPSVIQLLLERGAVPHSRTSKGFTPLHVAAARDCPKSLELLLQADCDPNERTDSGITPLHYAVTRARTEIIEALLAKGADPRCLIKRDGCIDVSPLSFVNQEQQARVAGMFGKYAPKPGVYTKLMRKVWNRFMA